MSGGARWTRIGRLSFIILMAALLFGCVKKAVIQEEPPTLPPPPEASVARPAPEPIPQAVPEKDPFEGILRKYRLKAMDQEKNRDWGKAHFSWKVVHAFAPSDPEARQKVEQLSSKSKREAEKHFLRGVELFERNAREAAAKEFAAAITYEPEHIAAIGYMEKIFKEPEFLEYQAVEGDTAGGISRKVYKNQDWGFLIAYFNDLGARETIRPGMKVKLPVVKPDPIVRTAPQEIYKKPAVPGKSERTTRSSPQEAEMHYEKGLKYFMADDLEKAIQEWEAAVQIDPDHPKANRDLDRAKRLREKLEQFRKQK